MIKQSILLALGVLPLMTAAVSVAATPQKPTIVLVHGAFADSSSWDGVVAILRKDGYRTIAAPNALRSPKRDAAEVAELVKSVNRPVVLVGHSYGGTVITGAASGLPNVKSLVFVAAFAPDAGETSLALSSKYPGGTLGTALLPPVDDGAGAGGKDLYIDQSKFADQFAADLPKARADLMAVSQRPITEAALTEPAGPPAWRDVPNWWIYGGADKNIPPAAMDFMAKRSSSRKTVVVPGGSHVVMISHAEQTAKLIEEAAGVN